MMTKKNVYVLLVSCLIAFLGTSCSRDDRSYDWLTDVDRLEIYEQKMTLLRENIREPQDLKYGNGLIHHTVVTPSGNCLDLKPGLLQLEARRPILINIYMYCEIHLGNGSIKRLEVHAANYVKYEGVYYYDKTGTLADVIESWVSKYSRSSIER